MKITKRLVALVLAVIISVGTLSGSAELAEAASFPVITGATLEVVADLSNETKNHSEIGYGLCNGEKAAVAIPVDLSSLGEGTVQLRLYTTSNVTDTFNVFLINAGDLYTAKRITGNIQVSYSSYSAESSIIGVTSPHSGCCTWNIALDGGKKYYFIVENIRADKVDKPTYGFGDVTASLVFKPAEASGNRLNLRDGKTVNNFLTLNTNEKEYYFGAEAGTETTLYFTFDGETAEKLGTGKVNVYNEYKELVATKSIYGSAASTKTEFSIDVDSEEKHQYTVKMSGIYGATTLRMVQSNGKVELIKSVISGGKSTITVKTFDIKNPSLSYIVGEYSKDELENDNTWNSATGIADAKFVVTEDGIYNVRAKSSSGRYYYASIKVGGIDNVAPTIDCVNTYNRAAVTLYKSTKDKDIAVMKLDDKKAIDGVTIAEEGTHILYLEDYAGNVTTKTFYIDRKAPEFKSDKIKNNAKLPNGYYTFKVSDAVSGIKSVRIDGVEQTVSSNMGITVSQNNHVIEIEDNAGNLTEINIKLDTSNKDNNGGNSGGSGNSGNSTGGSKFF